MHAHERGFARMCRYNSTTTTAKADEHRYTLSEKPAAPGVFSGDVSDRQVLVCTKNNGTRRATRYDINLFKCIYCGFCEEACPVDAIVETRIFEYHFEKRGENIMTKEKLLAIGDRYEAQIAADRAADARYR